MVTPSIYMLVPGKPGTKGDHNALHTLANFCPVDRDDSHLVREARRHDVSTKHFLLGKHDAPSSHDKRQTVPLGMAWISEDKLSESFNVNAKQMAHLISMLETNSLNGSTLTDFLKSGGTNIGKRKLDVFFDFSDYL